ncbi:MAG: TonB-dependent receptor domain-containing protein [Sphingomicrobium sp.]
MKSNVRQRLLASTLLFGTAAVPAPVWAQQAGTPTEPPANQTAPVTSQPDINAGTQDPGSSGQSTGQPVPAAQDIIITGSRIPRPDLTSSSPLAVVKAEEFKLSGATNVEQVINTLPQVIPGATAFSNNPGGGVATLNLRGLGTNRNLVLVNGRRYIFFDPTQRVDLNTIPSFLIDSVDVVTGGASAVYGSDAIAGVTNFHLRTDLKGAMVGGNYSISQRGDGPRYDIYGALGTQFGDGRGSLTVFGEYYNRGDIFQNQRGFSRVQLGDDGPDLVPAGSANVPQGRFTAPATVAIGAGASCGGTNQPPRNAGCFPVAENTIFNANNTGAIFLTPGAATAFRNPEDLYNFAPSNYLMVPQKRWTLGGYGEYEVLDGHHLYTEVTFVNNRVANQLAATPVTQAVNVPITGANSFCTATATTPAAIDAATCAILQTISANQLAANAAATAAGATLPFGSVAAGTGRVPALTAGFVRLTANYRFTQVNNRINTDDRNAFRVLTGMRGEAFPGWNYDVYYSYARTKNAQVQLGNTARSAFAANVQNGTCNIFGANQLSQECIDNTSILAQNQETSVLQVAQGSLSGHLFTLPWAHEGVGLATGVEWRKMAADFIPDTSLSSGDVVGFNAGDATSGNYNVREVFGELRVPIVEDNFINRFELNGAFRYSDYSLQNVGGVWTYAAGAELQPIKDVMLRGQYQRAVRAPNVSELFGGQAVGFPAATDPCATPAATTNAALNAACIANGVPASSVGTPALQPNAQIEGTFGGNPNLQEEVSDTYTAGVVFRPRFIPRFNTSIDWYSIKVKGAIAAAGGGVQGVLNECLNNGNQALCALIHRDPSGILSGNEFIVEANNANLASLRTKGIDWQVDYALPVTWGLLGERSRFSFFFLANYQWENSFTPIPGGEVIECAGRFGTQCGQPTPKWKWTSRLAWLDGPLTTSIRWRHLNSVSDDDPSTDFAVEKLPAYNLFDLSFALNVTDNATFAFGINNLFDKKPPILGSQSEQANTFPSTYDVLGRDFFFSVNFKL